MVTSVPSALSYALWPLEAAPIGWQLFLLGSSQGDSTAFPLCFDTYATRLLAQALTNFRHSCALGCGDVGHQKPQAQGVLYERRVALDGCYRFRRRSYRGYRYQHGLSRQMDRICARRHRQRDASQRAEVRSSSTCLRLQFRLGTCLLFNLPLHEKDKGRVSRSAKQRCSGVAAIEGCKRPTGIVL